MKDRPFIDRWRIAIVPEYANALAQFITGNILEFAPQQTDVLQVRKDVPQARMFRGEVTQSYRINHFGRTDFDTSPWRDDRVRRAMSMVLDRDPVRDHFSNRAEFEAAGLTLESRTHTHIPAYMTAYWADPKAGKLGPQSKFFLYDLAEAKRLMAAAGHAAGIEVDAFMNAGSEFGTAVYPELVQLTVDQLNRSGLFRTRLERLPYGEYFRRVQRDRAFKGVALQQPDLGDDVDLLIYRIYHTKGIRFYSVPDPKVDDFIERQRRELDEDKRVAILLDFQKYMGDMMYTFPGDGVSNAFHFKWPWLRNSAWPAWNEWLSADMPNRDG
jgi:ABC-type transport system substrate-binding protein